MAIHWLSDESANSTLPWVRDYLRGQGNVGDESVIREMIMSAKGITCICDDYKGMVWENSSLHNELKELIAELIKRPDNGVALIAKIQSSSSILVGMDIETMGEGIWIKTDKGARYALKKALTQDDSSPGSLLNQFMKALDLTNANETTSKQGGNLGRKSK